MAKTVTTWEIHSCNKGIGPLMMWASVLALRKRGTISPWHTDFAQRMSQRKKKTRTQLISSLPPSTRNTVPARWSDTGSKVACREISIIVLHASCGGQDLCLRFKGPYSKTTSLQLPLLHGTSSTHESRGCRRLYRFVCIHTTFRRLFHLTACACCWSDHFVGWSRCKANALSVFCWCMLGSAEYLMLFPL